MRAFATYKDEKGRHPLNQGLLWEYRLENFDWQKYRKTVAERVISMGRLSDWYAAFDLYGGIRGFRKIARDEDTRCYKQAQLRKAVLGEVPYTFSF